MENYIAELEKGVWVAPWVGDPGITIVKANAQIFKKRSTAWKAIEKAEDFRSFPKAIVTQI